MKTFPQQRLPYSEKVKNDYEWCKRTIDHLLIHYAPDNTSTRSSSEYNRKLSNYQLFNNQLNQADFERECNPLGLDVGQFKDQIQPYNKTYNKVQVLLGEELRRPFNFKVSLTSPNGIRSKLAHRDQLLKDFVYAQIQSTIQSFSSTHPQLLEDPSSVMDPKTIEMYMNTSYLESREITASKILEYLKRHLSIQEKKNDAFKHALLSGEEIVYVSHLNDEPTLEVINPLGFFYHKAADIKYIQDSLFAGYRTYMTAAEVLDRYGRYLTKEQIERIDTSFHGQLGSSQPKKTMDYYHDDYYYTSYLNRPYEEGSYGSPAVEDWLVQHVEWRSQRRVGILTFTNEYGDTEQKIVAENFPIPSNAQRTTTKTLFDKRTTIYSWSNMFTSYVLYFDYIPEIWTGTRIGHDIYCMMGPRPYQFRSPDNPFSVKLSYHGVVYSAMNAAPISLMDRMKPFQYLYFIIMHKLKQLIAKDVGNIFHFDHTMVEPSVGLEKTLYYLRELAIDIYNPLTHADTPGWSTRGKVTGSTDWSNTRHILNYVNLLSAIDQQISDTAGVTRQREGQIGATEAVSNASSAVQLSSVITDVYFQTHDKLWEGILSSLLNMSTELYRDRSITKQYFLDDLSLQTLQLSPQELSNESFGVFVVSSSKEARIFESLQSIGETLASSNKARFSDLINMYMANSSQELAALVKQSENDAIKEQQELQQQQQQAAMDLKAQELEFEREKLFAEIDKDIKIAEINSFRFLQDQDSDNNNVPDQLELEKFKHQTQVDNAKLSLEERKLDIQEKSINRPKK